MVRVRVVTVVQFSERSCVVTMQAADVLVASDCLVYANAVIPYNVPVTEPIPWMDVHKPRVPKLVQCILFPADGNGMARNSCRGALVLRAAGIANLMDIWATVQLHDNDRLVVNMYTQKQRQLPVALSRGSSQCFCPVYVDVALPHVPTSSLIRTLFIGFTSQQQVTAASPLLVIKPCQQQLNVRLSVIITKQKQQQVHHSFISYFCNSPQCSPGTQQEFSMFSDRDTKDQEVESVDKSVPVCAHCSGRMNWQWMTHLLIWWCYFVNPYAFWYALQLEWS